MEENDLFLFDWKVDQDGYNLEFFQPPPLAPVIPVTVLSEVATEPYWIIKPRGGPLHYYRPLKDHPGLARRFVDDGLLDEATAKDAFLQASQNRIPLITYLTQNSLADSSRLAFSNHGPFRTTPCVAGHWTPPRFQHPAQPAENNRHILSRRQILFISYKSCFKT